MNYRVNFFRIEKEKDEKGNMVKVGEQFVGSVVVDDYNTSDELPLISKAFRQASAICLLADKVVVEKL